MRTLKQNVVWIGLAAFVAFVLAGPAHCAIAKNSTFEVRTAGAATNGGGFKPGASGTDWSLFDNKNAAGCSSCGSSTVDLSTTDYVTNGTTTVTSLTANFGTSIVGNIIMIGGGTGALANKWYEVTARASATSITVDRTIGASTGATGNVGGAMDFAKTAADAILDGATNLNVSSTTLNFTIWIKSGTYTQTATTSVRFSNQGGPPFSVFGYQTTRGDHTGTRPLLTTATNSIDAFSFQSEGPLWFDNLSISSTAATRGLGLNTVGINATAGSIFVTNCIFDGLSYGIRGDWTTGNGTIFYLYVYNTEIKNSVNDAVLNTSSTTIVNSYLHTNGRDGIRTPNTNPYFFPVTVINSVIYNNTGIGINMLLGSGSGAPQSYNLLQLFNTAVTNNTSDGIRMANSIRLSLVNSVVENNGGFGINCNCGGNLLGLSANFNNAYRNNTSGNFSGVSAGTNDVTLTAECFTTLGSDWSPNNTAGGGAALKAAGVPGVFAGGGTGYMDIGPLQSQFGTGGGQKSCVGAR